MDLARFAHPALLARRCGTAHHLGFHHHAGPAQAAPNLGIYRQQVLNRNQVIMRWLAHRGGALDPRDHCAKNHGQPYPCARGSGADRPPWAPSRPCPIVFREYQFAGSCVVGAPSWINLAPGSALVRAGQRRDRTGRPYLPRRHPPQRLLPARALEGPYGDHTGYWQTSRQSSRFTIDCITRRDPSTTPPTLANRPTSPAVLGMALNELFVPLLRSSSRGVDFYLPPEGCSYRMALVQIKQGLSRSCPA